MAKLKASLSASDFSALDETLKTFYVQSGDNYVLDAEGVEDVEGLKKSKAQILQEKKDLQAKLDEMNKFKSEYEASKTAEEEKRMKEAGEFAELEKKLRAKITETEEAYKQKEASLLNSFKTERLKNELTAKGVLADRAKYALADISEQVELVPGEQGFSLKVKNGIGDAKEFDALIDGLKQSSPFFFAANNATGSGASGSESNTGGNAKQVPKAQWDAMDVKAQAAFIKSGGSIAD